MSFQIFKQKWAYHYKKYIAIILASLATACMLANFGVELAELIIANNPSAGISLSSVWNFLLFTAVYVTILVGNIKGTYTAYNGMLGFVFMEAFSTVFSLFLSGYDVIAGLISQNWYVILFVVLLFIFNVLSLLGGVMTYVRTRQYISGRYSSYRGVRNWCLLFMITSVVGAFTSPVVSYLSGASLSLIGETYLLQISEGIMSVCVYFTVLRLKSEY
ncbi:MAG: hypothetical protein LKF58_01415 [Bacilli bacterium]|jgi:hypothetical protein|nr:hypothetical protein [Bacilli bacterium]MCH4278296.1 hypothetical protein [Bacilli bacterium]